MDLYAWINNKGSCSGVAAGIGTACDNRNFRKTSLTRGPSRSNAVVETAEVNLIYFTYMSCIVFVQFYTFPNNVMIDLGFLILHNIIYPHIHTIFS